MENIRIYLLIAAIVFALIATFAAAMSIHHANKANKICKKLIKKDGI